MEHNQQITLITFLLVFTMFGLLLRPVKIKIFLPQKYFTRKLKSLVCPMKIIYPQTSLGKFSHTRVTRAFKFPRVIPIRRDR